MSIADAFGGMTPGSSASGTPTGIRSAPHFQNGRHSKSRSGRHNLTGPGSLPPISLSGSMGRSGLAMTPISQASNAKAHTGSGNAARRGTGRGQGWTPASAGAAIARLNFDDSESSSGDEDSDEDDDDMFDAEIENLMMRRAERQAVSNERAWQRGCACLVFLPTAFARTHAQAHTHTHTWTGCGACNALAHCLPFGSFQTPAPGKGCCQQPRNQLHTGGVGHLQLGEQPRAAQVLHRQCGAR